MSRRCLSYLDAGKARPTDPVRGAVIVGDIKSRDANAGEIPDGWMGGKGGGGSNICLSAAHTRQRSPFCEHREHAHAGLESRAHLAA